MEITPKHPALEQRPELRGWSALFCLKCGSYLILPPQSAATTKCPNCRGKTRNRVHDLSQPCEFCIEASDTARDKLDMSHGS